MGEDILKNNYQFKNKIRAIGHINYNVLDGKS